MILLNQFSMFSNTRNYTIFNKGTLQQLNEQAHEFVELLQSKFN